MSNVLLSILIPSIPERTGKLRELFNTLEEQIAGDPAVEILSFMDNKRRSLGVKRNGMIDAAQGEFITHLDDDDNVTEYYVPELIKAIEKDRTVDVIHFDNRSYLGEDDEEGFRVRTTMDQANIRKEDIEQAGKVAGKWRDINRPPWHWCCWRREFALRFPFPDGTMDEDWYFLRQALPCIQKSTYIDKVLHVYRWSQSGTRSNVGKPTT